MLRGPSGIPTTADVIDVAAGRSIARSASGGWIELASPTPGACTTFTPL
jgi:hypothetical protein